MSVRQTYSKADPNAVRFSGPRRTPVDHSQLTPVQIVVYCLIILASFFGALFGRHRYGYSYHTPAAGCCGCCAVAIMLPIAFVALKMLARMYGAFLQ